MQLKSNVKLALLKPQLLVAILVVEDIFKKAGIPFVITSVNDGEHMNGSKHYTGEAFDCRTKDINQATLRHSILSSIKSQLDRDFDIVDEGSHFHIEYDPK